MAKLFLFDIEGTTTDINFVHQVLFPYSQKRMSSFILSHQDDPEVKKACTMVQETLLSEEGKTLTSLEDIAQKLIHWIQTDRKHPALKTVQGLIWDFGYKSGDFKGHLYQDVKPFFLKLKELGHTIGIYSSGSVHAQKLIFGHSVEGDLTNLITFYFDTKVGAKREVRSYQNILRETNFKGEDTTFFSDIPEELSAAQEAGITPMQLLRPGTKSSAFNAISDFSQFKI